MEAQPERIVVSGRFAICPKTSQLEIDPLPAFIVRGVNSSGDDSPKHLVISVVFLNCLGAAKAFDRSGRRKGVALGYAVTGTVLEPRQGHRAIDQLGGEVGFFFTSFPDEWLPCAVVPIKGFFVSRHESKRFGLFVATNGAFVLEVTVDFLLLSDGEF